jgi:ribokinase
MLDVVTRATAPISPTSDTPALVRVGRGGSGANLAVALAGTGASVTYVGAVGRDGAATVVVDDLARAGVHARLQEFDGPTGVVVAVVAPEGQRAMMTDRGVNPRLTLEYVTAVLDEPFDHLHVSGYTVLDERSRSVAAGALALALRRGASTSIDVCSVAPLRVVGSATFLAAVADATTLFANEEEALTLAGQSDLDEALNVLRESFAEVMVTRGADGAVARRGDQEWRAAAVPSKVLDTTGAGDAATGTFLGVSLRSGSPTEALDAAMAAAAVVVAGVGSRG